MRNRTELVTTNLAESENEDDPSDLEDSEEDWKPDKKKGAAGAVPKPVTKSPKSASGGKRKSTGSPKGKGRTTKKAKKEESEPEDEEEEAGDVEDEEEMDEEEEEEDDDDVGNDSKDGNNKAPTKTGGSARSRKSANSRSVPDKDGKFELYIFKNDLTEDFKNDPKLCMWRRDGSSLLQKYIREKDEDGKTDELIFNGSSVYSCWEEKRKSNFFQVKVACVGDKKDSKVKVVDPEQLAQFAVSEGTKANDAEDENEEAEDEDEDGDGEGDGDGDGENDEDGDEEEE